MSELGINLKEKVSLSSYIGEGKITYIAQYSAILLSWKSRIPLPAEMAFLCNAEGPTLINRYLLLVRSVIRHTPKVDELYRKFQISEMCRRTSLQN